MSTYRSEYCPFCKKPLIIHKRSEFFDYNRYIGLPYERCPYCNHIYSTNKKLYSKMTIEEKSKISVCYFFNVLSLSFMLYAIVIFIIILVAEEAFNINIGDIVNYVFIPPILPCILLGYLFAKRNYNSLKELTINNFEIDEELKNINTQGTYKEDESLSDLLKKLK